jgi:hypothetical protein
MSITSDFLAVREKILVFVSGILGCHELQIGIG